MGVGEGYTPKYRQDAAHLVIDTGRTGAIDRSLVTGPAQVL